MILWFVGGLFIFLDIHKKFTFFIGCMKIQITSFPISTTSDPENSSIIPSDTGKLLLNKNTKKSPNKSRVDSLIPIKESDSNNPHNNISSDQPNSHNHHHTPLTNQNSNSNVRASIKNILNEPSAVAASFKQSLTSLKSGHKDHLKSHKNKSKKKQVVIGLG